MRNSKIRGNIIMLFTLLYIVYLSVVTYLLNSQGLFISLVDVSITNIGRRLIGDCWIAAIISGIFWGISHVPVRAVVYKYSFEGCIMACWNELGGGIVMGILFIFLFRKSKSIFIPTLIHAILDYLAMLPQK